MFVTTYKTARSLNREDHNHYLQFTTEQNHYRTVCVWLTSGGLEPRPILTLIWMPYRLRVACHSSGHVTEAMTYLFWEDRCLRIERAVNSIDCMRNQYLWRNESVGFAVDIVIPLVSFEVQMIRDARIHVPSEITPGVPTFSLHRHNGAGRCNGRESRWSGGPCSYLHGTAYWYNMEQLQRVIVCVTQVTHHS
jgi:hypothetical protein